MSVFSAGVSKNQRVQIGTGIALLSAEVTNMKAAEMKALTGEKKLMAAINVLCRRIERRTWEWKGDAASWAGFDYKRDRVHFTITKPVEVGVVSHRRIAVSMDSAIDCLTGNLSELPYEILF